MLPIITFLTWCQQQKKQHRLQWKAHTHNMDNHLKCTQNFNSTIQANLILREISLPKNQLNNIKSLTTNLWDIGKIHLNQCQLIIQIMLYLVLSILLYSSKYLHRCIQLIKLFLKRKRWTKSSCKPIRAQNIKLTKPIRVAINYLP